MRMGVSNGLTAVCALVWSDGLEAHSYQSRFTVEAQGK